MDFALDSVTFQKAQEGDPDRVMNEMARHSSTQFYDMATIAGSHTQALYCKIIKRDQLND